MASEHVLMQMLDEMNKVEAMLNNGIFKGQCKNLFYPSLSFFFSMNDNKNNNTIVIMFCACIIFFDVNCDGLEVVHSKVCNFLCTVSSNCEVFSITLLSVTTFRTAKTINRNVQIHGDAK